MINGWKLIKWLMDWQDNDFFEEGEGRKVLDEVIEHVSDMVNDSDLESGWRKVAPRAVVCKRCGVDVDIKLAAEYSFCPYCGRKIMGGPR